MSHHFDSPMSREDGRVDLTDLFVFPSGEPGRTVLILAVNPDAGLSSPTTFGPDARYVFNIDTDGDTVEDFGLEIRFGEPGRRDVQTLSLSRTDQPDAFLAQGETGQVVAVAGGGRIWAGLAADPFLADAFALGQFQEGIFMANRYDVSVFGAHPVDFSGGRNITAVALELPDDSFGPTSRIGVWASAHVEQDGAWTQINRAGKPMLHPLFTVVDEDLADGYNRTHPRDDLARYGEAFAGVVAAILHARGMAEPAEQAQRVVSRFLPDVLTYELGKPADFAAANGRALTDDVFAHTVGLVVDTPIRHGLDPRPAPGDFPHLAPGHHNHGLAPIMLRDAEGHPQLNPAAVMPAPGS